MQVQQVMRQHVCVIIHNLLDLYLTVDSYDTTIYHTSNVIFLCSTSKTDENGSEESCTPCS